MDSDHLSDSQKPVYQIDFTLETAVCVRKREEKTTTTCTEYLGFDTSQAFKHIYFRGLFNGVSPGEIALLFTGRNQGRQLYKSGQSPVNERREV